MARVSLLILLLGMAGITQSMWWYTPDISVAMGTGSFFAVFALCIIGLAGLLWHAERVLMLHNPLQLVFSDSKPLLLASLYLCSGIVLGLLLASHHLLIASWQSNILVDLFVTPSSSTSFSLLQVKQNVLIGNLLEQVIWLLPICACTLLWMLSLARKKPYLLWGMALLLTLVMIVFVLLYMKAFAGNIVFSTSAPTATTSLQNWRTVIQLVLETSMVGFGILAAFSLWKETLLQRSWLLPMLILMLVGNAVFAVAGLQLHQYTEMNLSSENLLLGIPIMLIENQQFTLGWLWLLLSILLATLKIALLATPLIRVAVAKLGGSAFAPALATVALVCVCTLVWVVLLETIVSNPDASADAVFQELFSQPVSIWHKVQLALLALIALITATDEHSNYVPYSWHFAGAALRFSYVAVIGIIVAIALY